MTFRPGLLDGRRVAVAGSSALAGAAPAAPAGYVDRAVLDRLEALGARVQVVDQADQTEPPDALVFLADEPFGDGGPDRLQAMLEMAWRAARDARLHASGRGGRLVFVGPGHRPARQHVEAARAGLENLARTLSVEWARFAVTAVAIAPGAETAAADVGDLVAYLLSDAGGYFSGCRFSLGTVTRTAAGGPSSA